MQRFVATCLAGGLALLAAAASAGGDAERGGRIDDAGLRVEWRYRPVSDAPADRGLGVLELTVADAATGSPVRYDDGRIAAWLQRRRGALPEAEIACRDRVRTLASQGIGRRADVDLNGWRLVTFNTDRTVAFIDPFVGLNGAKLESIVTLPGDIAGWAHQPARTSLWVHTVQAGAGRLVRIDTHRRAVVQQIAAPGAAAQLLPDRRDARLWVVSSDARRVGAVDAADPRATLRSTDAGALTGAVAAPDGGVFTLHDRQPGSPPQLILWQADPDGRPRSARQWRLPQPPVAAHWSAHAQRLLVALRDGRLAWIDQQAAGDAPERVLTVAPAGVRPAVLATFDDDRRLLWLDPGSARAGALDVGTGAALVDAPVAPHADTIAFTDGYAYLHSTAGGAATLLRLADLRAGRAQPVQVGTGSPTPGAAPGVRIASDPAGRGLLVANPADGVVYQYGEGMMAPIGSYSNYRRNALGLMVLDTGLVAAGPGRWRAALRHAAGGAHTLVISGVAPRLAACAIVDLPAPADAALALVPVVVASIESVVPLEEAGADRPPARRIQVRLRQQVETRPAEALADVPDLMLLVFDRRSGWQQRVPLAQTEPGAYAATLRLPHAGAYDCLVSSASRDLPFHAGRLGRIEVAAP